MYSIEDLKAAKAELARVSDRWAGYSGNNPDKYQSDLRAARTKVRQIEEQLKSAGVLERTEQEKLEAELDREFPNVRSKQIVQYCGRKYQRKFWPLEKSRSRKTVTEWGRGWECLD